MRIIACLGFAVAVAAAGCGTDSGGSGGTGVAGTDVGSAPDGSGDVAGPADETSDPGADTTAPDDTGSGPAGDAATPPGDGTGADTTPPEPAPLTTVTWNVGLALGYVEHAPERLPHIVAALEKETADVVCLEEVWLEADRTAVKTALETAGYHVAIYVTTGAAGGCTAEEVAPLQTCVAANCDTVPPSELIGCAIEHCAAEVGGVSSACQGCLTEDLTKPLPEIVAACVDNVNANAYVFGGHNGLVLATRAPLTDEKHIDFKASLTWRSLITGTIVHPGWGPIRLGCTHLTADLTAPPYDGEFGSWEAEQAQQIDQAVTELGGTAPTLFLGDLNCGPDGGADYVGELPANFAKLTTAGWRPHLVGKCTFCDDENPLIGGTGPGAQIDHILANAAFPDTGTPDIARTYDQPVDIEVGGATITSRLSDHYALRVTFPKPQP